MSRPPSVANTFLGSGQHTTYDRMLNPSQFTRVPTQQDSADSRERKPSAMRSPRPMGYRKDLRLGNQAFNQERFTDSSKLYRICLDKVPLERVMIRQRIYRNLGHSLMKQGDLLGATRAYEQADLTRPAVTVNLMVCFLILGDQSSAKKHFLNLIASCGDTKVIKGLSNAMIRAMGESEWILSCLGTAHPEIMEWIQAHSSVELFNIDEDIEKQICTISRGERPVAASFLLLALSRWEEARYYCIANEFDENSKVNVGISFLGMKELERGLSHFEEALKLNSRCWQALFNIGVCLRGKEGVEYLKKVNYELGLAALAELYEELGEWNKAVDALLMLISSGGHKNDSVALLRLATIYDTKLDNAQKALQFRKEAFEIDPSLSM